MSELHNHCIHCDAIKEYEANKERIAQLEAELDNWRKDRNQIGTHYALKEKDKRIAQLEAALHGIQDALDDGNVFKAEIIAQTALAEVLTGG